MSNQDGMLELVGFYAAFAAPLGVIAAIWAVFREARKAGWLLREGSLVAMPFFVWLLFEPCSRFGPGNVKSFFNMAVELSLCGVAGGLVLYPRLFARSAAPHKRALITGISAGIASLAAIAICLLFPTLPL